MQSKTFKFEFLWLYKYDYKLSHKLTNICGNKDAPDRANVYVELSFQHTSPEIQILLATTLSDKKEAWWGLSNF